MKFSQSPRTKEKKKEVENKEDSLNIISSKNSWLSFKTTNWKESLCNGGVGRGWGWGKQLTTPRKKEALFLKSGAGGKGEVEGSNPH